MKRTVALVLALLLGLAALPALAAGNILLTEDNAHYVIPHSKDYRVYDYAVVKNDGDARASVNDLLFEIRDRMDSTIESTSIVKPPMRSLSILVVSSMVLSPSWFFTTSIMPFISSSPILVAVTISTFAIPLF